MKTVTIQGRNYNWSEGEGLDPNAVLTLQGWIKKVARLYLPKAAALNIEFDDLIQAGNIGALNAARTFRPERSTSFLTWANYRITDEMQRLCRHPVAISLDAHVCGGADSAPISEQIPDTVNQAVSIDAAMQVKRLMSKLSRPEQILLSQYFGLGKNKKPMSLRAIGKQLGLSGQSISNRINKAIYKMRIHENSH